MPTGTDAKSRNTSLLQPGRRGLRRIFGAAAALGLAATLAGHAHAQQPPGEGAMKEAAARFREGLHFHDSGQEEEARLKFAQAYAVLKSPNILFNLARSEQLTGHSLDALRHYKAYAGDGDPKITPKDRDTAKARIAELAQKVGHVSVDAPVGTKVTVDGAEVAGEAPFAEPLDVEAGKHLLGAKLGEASKSLDVSAGAGETVPAKVVFEGPVVVPVGPTNPGNPPVPPPGGPETPTPAPASGAKTATVIALATGAAVGAVVGLYLLTDAKSADSEAKRLLHGVGCVGSTSAACARAKQLQNRTNTDQAGGFVGVGVGAALLVGAILTPMLWRSASTQSSSTWLVPSPLPGGGALELGGRF